MVDAIVMRVSSHDDINTFSQNANVPIINALSDESHLNKIPNKQHFCFCFSLYTSLQMNDTLNFE
jgi:hypothetical protein